MCAHHVPAGRGGRREIFGKGQGRRPATARWAGIRAASRQVENVPRAAFAPRGADSFLLETKRKKSRAEETPRVVVFPSRSRQARREARAANSKRGRPGRRFQAPRLYGRAADALAAAGDEGRGKLRKSPGRRMRPLIRGCPNGATRPPRGGRPRPNQLGRAARDSAK